MNLLSYIQPVLMHGAGMGVGTIFETQDTAIVVFKTLYHIDDLIQFCVQVPVCDSVTAVSSLNHLNESGCGQIAHNVSQIFIRDVQPAVEIPYGINLPFVGAQKNKRSYGIF